LSDIFNLARLLKTPHTPEQIGTLWQAYHASRSKGTGRGYLCSTIPVDTYLKLADTGKKYPSFVLPLSRESGDISAEGQPEKAYEFYFLQWAFHDTPPVPTYERETALFPTSVPTGEGSNPATSTVLFTPLQEYKLRQAFATPYLVLTFYTDLAASHGIVLLRGEITPTTTSAPVPGAENGGTDIRYFLSQQDAQLLAIGMQRFYLWKDGQGSSSREDLLKAFYERPEEFKWEELLKHADVA
jgi:ATP synthase F1 complex assembly factor 1